MKKLQYIGIFIAMMIFSASSFAQDKTTSRSGSCNESNHGTYEENNQVPSPGLENGGSSNDSGTQGDSGSQDDSGSSDDIDPIINWINSSSNEDDGDDG